MALDKSKYIIYRVPIKGNYLTIFRFKAKYDGLSSFFKFLNLPIFLLSILIFSLQFKSLSLIKKLLSGDFEDVKEISIVDHELEVLKNFDEYPTKDILDYLDVKSREVKDFIKTSNITYTRWFSKYKEHFFNLKLLEKYSENSKYVSFVGCIPFPCLLNFRENNFNILTSLSFLVSALPMFVASIFKFILFALGTNESLNFTEKGIKRLRIYRLTKTNNIKNRKQIIVSIYFFREIEHLHEIVKSLPDQYEFIIISLNRVEGIETFFSKNKLNINSEYLRVRNINYFGKLVKNSVHILIHPIYILSKRKKLNATLFFAFIYNFFSTTTITRLICLREIINMNFENYKFLSFNSWELAFIFYYNDKLVKNFGRYCLVPGVYTSQYFRPHDYILSINKFQFSKFNYLHKNNVFLLGKNIEEKSKINDFYNKTFQINSKKYVIWIGSTRGPSMSNEMLITSLKKTKVLSDYFGLELIIRLHPTLSKDNFSEIYGEFIKEDFIFDNNSPLEEVAKMPAIFSLTNSTADLTIFKYLNPCVCLGIDKIFYKIDQPSKKMLGELCNESEDIVIEALKKLDNNQRNFDAYKMKVSKYVNSICFLNEKFDEQLLNIFQN